MESEPTKIKIDVEAWNIKVEERKRNRMKLQIKLSKDEATAYRNFADICKPLEITDADFMKTVFLTGIEAMNQQLADLVREYAKENVDELASSGITVLEGDDGEIKLADSSVLGNDMSGATTTVDPENFLDKAQTADKLNEEVQKYTE